MRVLAATTAGTGHFGPMIPVLQACAAAGHEVLVACPDSFVRQVNQAGLACAPFDDAPGDQMAAVFGSVQGLSYEDGNRVVIREAFGRLDTEAALGRLSATFSEWRPDVVVRDPSEYGSWVLAERDSVPHVRVAIGLLSSEAVYASFAAAGLAEAANRHGMPLDPDGSRLMRGPVVAAAPESFDPPDGVDPGSVSRYATSPALDPHPPEQLPAGDEPLVYVTFGTVAAAVGLWPRVYRSILDGLADAPVRILVTTGFGVDPSELGPLPSRVAVAEFVAQDTVLAHSAVMVTHGGYGTVLGGLRSGVPMVVTPMFADQHDNAARVASMGAGVHVQPSSEPMAVPPELGSEVRAAVLRLLEDDDPRATAGRLSGEMAGQPPLGSVVGLIEAAAPG